MSCDDELLDGFPTDEPHVPLDRLRYAARVGPLIRAPAALAHWRRRCRESFAEARERRARHRAWADVLAGYVRQADEQLRCEACDGAGGPSPELGGSHGPAIRRLARSLAGPEPFAGGPLPLSRRHALSLADSFLVLALLHDEARRDAGGIDPFGCAGGAEDSPDTGRTGAPRGVGETMFWWGQASCLSGLRAADQPTIDDCLARVEADLRSIAPVAPATPQRVEVVNWEEGGRTFFGWFRGLLSGLFTGRTSARSKPPGKRGHPGLAPETREQMVKDYDVFKASGLTAREYVRRRGNFPGKDEGEWLAYLDRCRKQWEKRRGK